MLTLEALCAKKMCQSAGRVFIFCLMKRGDILKDKPISGTDVYRIVKAAEAFSGVEFKPHDLRQTFFTDAAAGHARSEKTLRYAQTVNARQARKAL